MKKKVKADFAAIGFSSFQTKYITSPRRGRQHRVIVFTIQFGLSSSVIFFMRTPQWIQISACSETFLPQCIQNTTVPPKVY